MQLSNSRKKYDIFLVIYLFFVVFAPPIIPAGSVYVVGLFTFFLVIASSHAVVSVNIMFNSGMWKFYKLYLFTVAYTILIRIFRVIICGEFGFGNDLLRTINQFLVLSGFELLSACYVVTRAKRKGLKFEDILYNIGIVGAIQGLLSILSYFIPSLRSFFLKYQTVLLENEWHLLRRGYGYSSIMLDLFGYGMGVIAGVTLLSPKIKKTSKGIIISLSLISTLLNARTGLVVFGIAVLIFLFRIGKLKNYVFKLPLGLIILSASYFVVIPKLIDLLSNSSNLNFKWISEGLSSIYMTMNGTNPVGKGMLSDYTHYPSDFAGQLFGTGHTIYGMRAIMGIHSDAGYVNYIWQLGVIGTILFCFIFCYIFFAEIKKADKEEKSILIFLLLSFWIVMFKARPVGYNPGIVITYIVFAAYKYLGMNNMRGPREKATGIR